MEHLSDTLLWWAAAVMLLLKIAAIRRVIRSGELGRITDEARVAQRRRTSLREYIASLRS